ncbi:MAG: DUF4175 family protein [Elusimicrobiota bacterium]
MSQSKNEILTFIKKSNAFGIFSLCLRGFLKILPVIFLGLIIFNLLENFLQISNLLRFILWFLWVGGILFVFIQSFAPFEQFSIRHQSKKLSEYSREKEEIFFREDDLNMASEFIKNNRNNHFVDNFLDAFSPKLSRVSPSWCFQSLEWGRIFSLAVFSIFFFVGLKVVFPQYWQTHRYLLLPFSQFKFDDYFDVVPGHTELEKGSDLNVLISKKADKMTPLILIPDVELLVQSSGGWVAVPFVDEQVNQKKFIVKTVVDPLQYRFKVKGLLSSKYFVELKPSIDIEKWMVTVTPPAYCQQEPLIQASPDINGLRGSQVEMRVFFQSDIEQVDLKFLKNHQTLAMEKMSEKEFRVRFSITEEDEMNLSVMLPSKKMSLLPYSYKVRVIPDLPPSMTLLSPDKDLVVSEDDDIPLNFDVKDDFGLSELRLVWRNQKLPENKKTIKNFSKGTFQDLSAVMWNLRAFNIKSGELIQYRLEAVDNNIVTGPGVTLTPWLYLEVTSFEKEHELIENVLEKWRDEMLELLAQTNVLGSKVSAKVPDFKQSILDFRPISENSLKLEKVLEQIVERMEKDPLSDVAVWLEHQAMLEGFKALNNLTVQQIASSLQTQNQSASSIGIKLMSSEIERMLSLSEDLSKAQNARDVLDTTDSLEKIGESLNEKLESQDKLSPADMKEINDMLQEANRLLSEMSKTLSELPQELPEDFVNQEALKDLKIDESSDLLSQIKEAMKNGDAKKALEKAKEFLKAAQQLRKQMEKAHDSFLESRSLDEIEKQMESLKGKWDQLAEEERTLLSQTQKMESQRLNELMKKQEEALLLLLNKQKNVIELTKSKMPEISVKENKTLYLMMLNQLKSMEEVAAEFQLKKVEKSFNILPLIIDGLMGIKSALLKTPEDSSYLEWLDKITIDEQEVFDELKKISSQKAPSGQNQEQFNSMSQEQSKTIEKTNSLKKDLQKLAQKTATLGLPLMEPLQSAMESMQTASQELSSGNSQKAKAAQEKALDSLEQGQLALSAAQMMMGQMQEGLGEGDKEGESSKRGGKVRIRNSSPQNGRSGGSVDRVRLPRLDEYKPPKQFREDIMDSLKEKYPKAYEEIIHKYYKRLTQ